jgi:superfamily I DNA and/or RNA helicase
MIDLIVLSLFEEDVRLVACTILTAARHMYIQTFNLDYCVMDEAGQVVQPAALGAILLTKRYLHNSTLSSGMKS